MAAVFSAAMNFSACSNMNSNVYGPPLEEWEYEETVANTVNNDVTAQNVTGQLSDITENPLADTEHEGVYYTPVSEREIGYVFINNAEVLFSFDYLYYNNSMYTSSYEISSADKADIEAFAEGIRENELTAVYSNRAIFWSEDSSKLSYADDNINGKIYSMSGYDEDFRVCVCYERYIEPINETYYGFIMFDKLNDITLNKGSDLFKDRLHLDEYAKVCIMRNDEMGGDYEETLSEDISELVQAMMDGRFTQADNDTQEKLSKCESCTLVFYSKTGLSTTVSVYPDGYVSMKSGRNTFIEEVNPQACGDMIKYIT